MQLPALTLGLLLMAGAQAQVYTWVDEHGNTHYGDRPPMEHQAETLDMATGGLSTMGGAGLRPAEEAALARLREEEAAAAERGLQRRALALEQQRIRNERLAAEAALEAALEPEASRVIYGGSVAYPVIPYDDRYRYGFSFEYQHGKKYDRWGRHRPRPEQHGDGRHRPAQQRRSPATTPQAPQGLTHRGGRLGVTAGGP